MKDKDKMGANRHRMRKNEVQSLVLEFLQHSPNQAFNYKQIAYGIGATQRSNRIDVINILDALTAAGEIVEVSLGRYKAKANRGTESVGYFVRRSNGRNSVIVDDESIFVAERNSMHALNGDKVRVVVSASRRGQDPEARVVEIIEAKEQTFVGEVKIDDNNVAVLVPDSKFLAADILIPRSKLHGAKNGDKAVARIVKWRDDEMTPRGEIVDVLGEKGDNDVEMNAILAEYGLPYRYPPAVEKAADKIDAGITDEEVARREDFRQVTTFTIDPRDAKDFDDALSIRRLENGNWEVGVHIADVTHYVQPGSIIDREAQQRATSVYLVDRTIPMLPEHLSNGICSLRPDEDKLTYSAIFELDEEANVVNCRIHRTVIRSNRRFTYEEAQQIIETGEGDFSEEILQLNALAKKLRQRRFDNGAVEFDRVEVRFEIDEKGHPVSVFFKESKDANKLIEEFMLLANMHVAQSVGMAARGKKAKTFVYRVHDTPDPEKMGNFALIAARFGFRIVTDGRAREVNQSLNKMLRDVKGRGEENMLSILAIRSMAKAVYTTENIGHYGLALDYYTHFTSPIRRYPDMMVHRLLTRYAEGGRSADRVKTEEQCKHSSDMEQLAANAERASTRYKQVEYMTDHIGEVYDGIISHVTEWGLYVELDENKCEGLVPVRDLPDKYYDFDEKNYCLIGRNTHVRYTLGDRVKIQVARADLDRRQLDFALVSDSGNPDKPLAPVNFNRGKSHKGRPNKRPAKGMRNKRR